MFNTSNELVHRINELKTNDTYASINNAIYQVIKEEEIKVNNETCIMGNQRPWSVIIGPVAVSVTLPGINTVKSLFTCQVTDLLLAHVLEAGQLTGAEEDLGHTEADLLRVRLQEVQDLAGGVPLGSGTGTRRRDWDKDREWDRN